MTLVSMPGPLTDTVDPGRYVARPDTENALSELEAAIEEGARITLLSGPPGMGKTLLLHVLKERMRYAHRLIFSPFLHFDPDEADDWLRGLLLDAGLHGAEADDWRAIARRASADRPLVLIVDEAQSIPPETAAHLADEIRQVGTGLYGVLAGTDGPPLDRVVTALGEPVARVRLEERLTPGEVSDLAEGAMAEGSELAAKRPGFVSTAARALHASAEGNPRALKSLIFRMEFGEPPPELEREAAEPPPPEAVREPSEGDRSETTAARHSDSAASLEPSMPSVSEADDERGRSTVTRSAQVTDTHAFARGVRHRFIDLGRGAAAGAHRAGEIGTRGRRLASRGALAIRKGISGLSEPPRIVDVLTVALAFAIGISVPHFVLRGDPAAELDPRPLAPVAGPAPVGAPPPDTLQAASPSDPSDDVTVSAPSVLVEDAVPHVGEPPDASPSAAGFAVTLQVNARPWASIRFDGEDLGATPLIRPDTLPGRYEVEATFPDGRVMTRVVQIGPDSRFVGFP